jgi:DNA-binding GntR family transcriptional regulator
MHGTNATTKELSCYLLLSPQRIRQLTQEGVLQRAKRNGHFVKGRFNLLAAVNAYITYQRSKASRAALGDEYFQLKQRRLKAITEREEMLTDEMRGKYLLATVVEEAQILRLTFFRAKCLGIPTAISRSLMALTAGDLTESERFRQIYEVVEAKIYEALHALADLGAMAPEERARAIEKMIADYEAQRAPSASAVS